MSIHNFQEGCLGLGQKFVKEKVICQMMEQLKQQEKALRLTIKTIPEGTVLYTARHKSL